MRPVTTGVCRGAQRCYGMSDIGGWVGSEERRTHVVPGDETGKQGLEGITISKSRSRNFSERGLYYSQPVYATFSGCPGHMLQELRSTIES